MCVTRTSHMQMAHIDTRSTPVKEQDGEDPGAARLCYLRSNPVDVQRRSAQAVMFRTVAVPGLQMAAGPMPRGSHPARSLQTSTQNCSCEISMCVSTAQAHAKRLSRDSCTALFLQISTQKALDGSCDMSMCVSTAQAHEKQVFGDSRTALFLRISTQNGSCEISMCISAARAMAGSRMTTVAGFGYSTFLAKFYTKSLFWNVHVCFDWAGSRTATVAGFAYGNLPANFYTNGSCEMSMRRLAQTTVAGFVYGIFLANFHTEGSCEMSMCILTAQARENDCRAFFCVRHFSCKFQHKRALVKRLGWCGNVKASNLVFVLMIMAKLVSKETKKGPGWTTQRYANVIKRW